MNVKLYSNDSSSVVQGFPDGKHILELIYRICEKGSDAEVRRNKDGTYKVYEVRKRIAG